MNARLAAGLTQVELARQIQKPQSYVSKYERGERRVDFTEFIHIGTILKIDPRQFIAEYLQKTSA
ncbi:helix-turn-helix domain-containing protein [Methylophilus rhizosphaerae]|uniref:helix-turn-helix domain-containing protein n=1 Tax=Methylophilus rhizosphaerae TaxID=492660 RepID=UPI001C40950F|nr:helix-turn-helix transcriptional regulator [Methylophilus rhizosphaerae]